MLTEIKALNDKKAKEELVITQNYLKEQHERDMHYIRMKYKAMNDLSLDEPSVNTVTIHEDASVVDYVKSHRLNTWLSNQNTAHQRNLEQEHLSTISGKQSEKLTDVKRETAISNPQDQHIPQSSILNPPPRNQFNVQPVNQS